MDDLSMQAKLDAAEKRANTQFAATFDELRKALGNDLGTEGGLCAILTGIETVRAERDALQARLVEATRLDGVRMEQIRVLQEIIAGDTTPAGIEVARYRSDVESLRSKLGRLVTAVGEYRTYYFKGGRTTAELLDAAIAAATGKDGSP